MLPKLIPSENFPEIENVAICAPYYVGVGDLWALCSWAILHRPCVMSVIRGKGGSNVYGKILECLRLFDWDFRDLYLLDRPFTKIEKSKHPNYLQFGVGCHLKPFVSTKICPTPIVNRYAYRLDTWTGHHPERFLGKESQKNLLTSLEQSGAELYEILPTWPLRKVVEELANSERFYTIDSGLAHICLSVGTPLFLKGYSGIEYFYPNKQYTLF